jgi:hypothetical protein
MDKYITDFTKLYLGYPTSINHSFLYTPAKHRGGGLEPLEDLVNIITITNTTIAINDWDNHNYWQRVNDKQSKDTPSGSHGGTRQAYLMASNQFTKNTSGSISLPRILPALLEGSSEGQQHAR